MEWSKQNEFNEFLVENDIVEFRKKKVKLSSGRKSNLYINLRKLTDYTGITFEKTLDFMVSFVDEMNIHSDSFVGVAEGATKIGLFLTYRNAKVKNQELPLVMSRGKEKKHGSYKDRYYIGPLGKTTSVIEDVLTTGGSLIKEIEKLKKTDTPVNSVIGLVDRLELRKDGLSVAENLSNIGLHYCPMTDVKTLLPLAYEIIKPPKRLAKKINRYYSKYSCEKVEINI